VKPRLHILLARASPLALVLRRGPSNAVAAIEWNRDTDRFKVGQWLRGRIYEKRCDLSPDGKLFLYFAMNGRWSSPTRGAWTAISYAPYLRAIALFAKGDCWHGGGMFVDNRTYWLNDGYGHEVLSDTTEVQRAEPAPYAPHWGGECWGVYFNRLGRDGWTARPELAPPRTRSGGMMVFERPLSHGWVLRKLARAGNAPPGRGVYFDEHELIEPGRGRALRRHDWEWADFDGDRLVWAESGALWAGQINARSYKLEDPIDRPTLLHDFSAMTFEALRAPYEQGSYHGHDASEGDDDEDDDEQVREPPKRKRARAAAAPAPKKPVRDRATE
jgi:hypothetical protein